MPETDCLVGTAGRVARAIGMGSRAGQPAAIHDEVFFADWTPVKPAFQNLSSARCVPCLRRQRGTRHVWRHSLVRHSAPGMIARRRLREPHIAGIAGKLSALECPYDRITIADLSPRSI